MRSLGFVPDPALRGIYSNWCDNNISYWNTYINIIAVLSMAILIPFDMILFKGYFYPEARTILISLISIAYMLSQSKFAKKFKRSPSICITFTVSILLFAYLYFLVYASKENRTIVLVGTALVVIFSNIALYRFWRLQVLYCLEAGFLFIVCSYVLKVRYDFVLLTIANVIASVFALLFRRIFASSLVEKFLLTRALVPEQVANFITTSGHMESLETAFPLKLRLVACVCCDWRGYQELSNKISPLELSQLQEEFYNLVFEKLRSVDAKGCYFANWTADELFVVFYDANDEKPVAEKAVLLALELQGEIFDKFNVKAKIPIMYDVGVSIGTGVLGLQGPKLFKKTTITGPVAGNAKRFETEAKLMRKKSNPLSPIIVTTKDLLANCSQPLSQHRLIDGLATSKDIGGTSVVYIVKDNDRLMESA